MTQHRTARRRALAAILLEIVSGIRGSTPGSTVEHWADDDYEYTEIQLPGLPATALDLSIHGTTVLIRSIPADVSETLNLTVIGTAAG